MIQLGPNFDLSLHFVIIVNHLHLAIGVVPDCSFSLQRRLVHNFHRKLHLFLVFVLLLLTAPNYSLHLAEATLSDSIHHLELIHKLLVAFYSDGHFIGKVHAVALFEKLVVCKVQVRNVLHLRVQMLTSQIVLKSLLRLH